MSAKPPNEMTDTEFLAWYLADGEPRSLGQILQASHEIRGCRMTVHSRASDLRRLGYDVAQFNDKTRHPRDKSMYQLLGSPGDQMSLLTSAA